MKLTELFTNTPVEVHWSKQGPMHLGSFNIENTQYLIQLIKMSPKDQIHSVFPDELMTKNTWFFAFAAMVNGRPVDTDTNKGDSIKIFSTILQTLEQFILDNKVDVLYLGCSDKHTKLKSVYQRLISKYTKIHGWSIEKTVTGNFFGDKKFVWILKK